MLNLLFKRASWFALILTTALYIPLSFAATLPNFKTSYYVNAFGVDLGKAKHRFTCHQQNCTLVSEAKPSGVAAMFFKDRSIETIQLQQTPTSFTWLSYHKQGISKKNGNEEIKHTTLKRDKANQKIVYVEKKRNWPIQPNTFDIMSLAYAIQYFKLNNRPLNTIELHIQDSNFQEKLQLKQANHPEPLHFKFSNNAFNTLKYTLESKQSRLELWLLPNYDYFPSKIRLIDKKENKTITLNLAELPTRL